MTGGDDDRVLRERFAALRAEATQAAPTFADVRARAPIARRHRRTPAFALAAVTAAVVVGSLVLWPKREPGFDRNHEVPSITQWRSPTAFLLESPAASLLHAAPAVGERWVMVP